MACPLVNRIPVKLSCNLSPNFVVNSGYARFTTLVTVTFHDRIVFHELRINVRGDMLKLLNQQRFQNLCVYLDDVVEMCTASDRQSLQYVDGSH